MAEVAALWDCPTTPGTETQVPFESTRLTGVFGGTLAPGGRVLGRDDPAC